MENSECTTAEKALYEMFKRLVPGNGNCETVAGEIVRAYTRINYRFYNDGDRIGVGYGKQTCNAPARYLIEKCDDAVAKVVERMCWGRRYGDDEMNDLANAVYEFLTKNPNLETTKNDEDMWDYTDDDDTYDCWGDSEEDDWYDNCEDEEDFIDNGDCEDDSDY